MRSDRLAAAALAGVLLAGYTATLLPGPGFHGDTAKFQFVGRVLGTPHATGYPSYLLLSHAFTRLVPFGSLAFRANLLSALCSVGAALLLFGIQRRLGVAPLFALAGALAFGWWGTVWTESIVAEVYALHLLLWNGVLYAFLRWHLGRERRWLLGGAALYALAFGNHLTTVTLLPALVFLVFATERRAFLDPRVVAPVLGFIALGALQYAVLFWRSADPTTPYVEIPVTSLAGLWRETSGGQFRGQMLAFSPRELLLERLPMFLGLWLRETLPLLPIAVYGALRAARGAADVFLLLAFLGPVAWALTLDFPDIYLYFTPAFAITAVYVGRGLQALPARVRDAAWARGLLAALLVATAAIGWLRIRAEVHQSPVTLGAPQARAWIEAAGQNALILSPHYHASEVLWYHLIGEGLGRERNLHAVHHVQVPALRAYLEEGRPFLLPEERRPTPPGLAVFGVSPSQRAALEAAGLRTRDAAPPLYRVESAPGPTRHSAGPG